MTDYEGQDIMHAAAKAMGFVVAFYNDLATTPTGAEIDSSQVRLVWFCKTLENWKALVVTTLNDQMYYEVTYSGKNKNTCVDAYVKVDSVMIPDAEEERAFDEPAPLVDDNGIKYKSFEDVHGAENDPRWTAGD